MRFFNSTKLVQLADPPASPSNGWTYYDTTLAKVGVYINGWVYLPAAASGVANFLPRVTVGLIVSTVATMRAASHSVGVAVSQVGTLLTPTTPGISITSTVSGTIKPPVTPGVALTQIASMTTPQTPAAKIVHIKYDLVATNGSNAATSTGAQAWPSIANAQGRRDGVYAQAQGSLTAAQDFTARLAYAAQANKTALTITAVKLNYYYVLNSLTSTMNRTLRATWTGGTYNSGAFTATQDDRSVTPFTVDLFALGVTDWTKINSLVAFVDSHANSGAVSDTCQLDAVELVITATQTIPQ